MSWNKALAKTFFNGIIIILLLLAASLSAEEGFEYDAKGKRDPFVPLVSVEGVYMSDAEGISGIKDISLEGIVWDEISGSAAIVNGEIMKEGEEIGSVKLLKIQKDGVIFEVEGEAVKVDLTDE